ncbi:hypothetical protein AVEN_156858-1 [Araneus ventricosus]|uniref:Uncharacterized protein n=1 Tax=Araneus ventricosus TaxID=182803 RepID=A0A4Y2UFE6_ARAVE|nr:hypothetical protein AVEN_156858-1 [Araneus ventricosus]
MGSELAVGILSVIFQNKTLTRLGELSTLLKEEYGIDGQITEAFDFTQTKSEKLLPPEVRTRSSNIGCQQCFEVRALSSIVHAMKWGKVVLSFSIN